MGAATFALLSLRRLPAAHGGLYAVRPRLTWSGPPPQRSGPDMKAARPPREGAVGQLRAAVVTGMR